MGPGAPDGVTNGDRRPATRAKARSTIPTTTSQVGPEPGTSVGVSVSVGGVVGMGVGPDDGEAVGPDAAQVERVIVSLIKVTWPFRASARPLSVTPSFIVIDVRARMVPAKVEPDPSVAELVTCQKTLQG